jgi:DNA replication protein DnaC
LKDLNPTEISELSELLGPAPLLPGESEADYEALKMRIMAAVKPADAIEYLYVRDVIDLQWDLLRFRRLKSHLLSSTAPSGLAALMSARKYIHFNDTRFASWLNNDPKAVKEIKALRTQWGLTEQDIHAQTMVKKINEFERRIRLARFPQTKRFDTFDFTAQPSLNKSLVLELSRCQWVDTRHNCIALGPSGTGKTHVALALGLAACQKGYSVAFKTAAALVHELMEARDERRLRALQKHLNTVELLIIDELGYVPFTAVGAIEANPPFAKKTVIGIAYPFA